MTLELCGSCVGVALELYGSGIDLLCASSLTVTSGTVVEVGLRNSIECEPVCCLMDVMVVVAFMCRCFSFVCSEL